MTSGPLESMIATYIAETLLGSPGATIDPDENLFTGGYVDSVGILRLIAHVESTLGIAIPPIDLVPQNFRSVRAMAGYLARAHAGV